MTAAKSSHARHQCSTVRKFNANHLVLRGNRLRRSSVPTLIIWDNLRNKNLSCPRVAGKLLSRRPPPVSSEATEHGQFVPPQEAACDEPHLFDHPLSSPDDIVGRCQSQLLTIGAATQPPVYRINLFPHRGSPTTGEERTSIGVHGLPTA
jgi:hypothetical protein